MSTPLAEVPNSYAIVLPPGWIRVSLTGTTTTAVKDLADRIFQRIPRDEALDARRNIETQLTGMIQKAKSGNGLDLYVPVEQMHGRTIAASFIVGGVMLPDEIDGLESLALLGDLARDGKPVEVDGELGVRAERTEEADAAYKVDVASRRVDYAFPVPGDGRRWLVVTFSTPGAGRADDQVADALVQLFDAMMTTFRWRR
ncbi:hypothetical protein KGQ20_03825 [Catenulispora sp. NF23]|uniref:Uncharacterized protein n=1 Tax=Catenulispora pinistramenti TaxID=2705254 RepID=A0ABS5KMY6_9ACTN|nr:hypothetical protein [Catenulispora pinistramenti]MBS2531895.1 hypothetical protein [Catenulispora pinistramenti]MBS2547374.1 hypothetical protein [Catenulispora pinistramenti]